MKLPLVILILTISTGLFAQETVFTVLQGPTKLGDKALDRGDYERAIELYGSSISRGPDNVELQLKLALCYYSIKDYRKSVDTYDAVIKAGAKLKPQDMYRYAESQSSLQNYPVAIAYYKKCLEQDPDNEMISKKVWAISNINFLREDSSHYVVKPLFKANTGASEMSPALLTNALVFSSNRKGSRAIDFASGDATGLFYEPYIMEWRVDSLSGEKTFSNPAKFAKSLGLAYNVGPIAFYDQNKKMVFVASGQTTAEDGIRPLGLYFAQLQGSKWKTTGAWSHNSEIYSISDVTINEDGDRIYFSSNIKGGIGGKDIYISILKDALWSKPVNLGETINTRGDEIFPYLHRNGTLYFSSDGLPGMGGLDIFQTTIKPNGYSEPQNVGYPVNSHGDDFGLIFDSLATHGYLSSNRVNGGFDDDIFEFEMHLQTYPFQMTGVLKYKDHTWSDTLDIHEWPAVKVTLVDTWQDTHVDETTSGPDGKFSLTIPYFSRYHIVVTDETGHQHKASLELEKHRTEAFLYEIVVVKDMFAELKDQGQK